MAIEHFTSRRQYPVQCPACREIMGYPTVVETVKSKPGFIRIEICCHACHTRWFQEVDIEDQ